MPESLALQAFVFGLISAASLPVGAALAMVWSPRQRLVAGLMAFGGGALLAALTLDLVAEAMKKGEFYALAGGCLVGGLLFVVLNRVVNDYGGFLRKAATTMTYLRREKMRAYRHVFELLSRVAVFRELPAEELSDLVYYVTGRTFPKGGVIIRQGEPGDSLFIIEAGGVDLVDERGGGRVITRMGAGDVFGELALVTGVPRSATAIASEDTRVWLVLKEHFDHLVQHSPRLAAAVTALARQRLAERREARDAGGAATAGADAWVDAALRDLDHKVAPPTDTEIREAAKAHHGAPLAIWLGMVLDGIPESLVIGASLLDAKISASLIAGLFLSNFPEALSSSAGMREQGYGKARILAMWVSLMLVTGVGAWLGNVVFIGIPHGVFAFVEGVAAGAMLTMIAETMLPEAYQRGGAVTGVSTLLGFLAALFFKTLE